MNYGNFDGKLGKLHGTGVSFNQALSWSGVCKAAKDRVGNIALCSRSIERPPLHCSQRPAVPIYLQSGLGLSDIYAHTGVFISSCQGSGAEAGLLSCFETEFSHLNNKPMVNHWKMEKCYFTQHFCLELLGIKATALL